MSTMLDKARQQFEAGKYKAAVASLWDVEQEVRGGDDIEGAQALLDLASALREQTAGRLRADCDALSGYAHKALDQGVRHGTDLRVGALAVLPDCLLIGGSGFDIERPEEGTWDVIFKDDQVLLHQLVRSVSGEDYRGPGQVLEIAWAGLSIDIGGAGAMRKGGGFIGGGFGIVGAAAGMLTASALNAMTSSTSIDTVIHLQAASGELFLHYGQQTPEVLRRTLSPVFTKLRQGQPRDTAQSNASADHVVDRLHKLADLLDRGVVTPEEFAQLKADLLSGRS
jgi:hypothetical protein